MPARDAFLLVKPPYEYYPMGLAYVASTLEREGVPYDYVDTWREDLNLEARLGTGKYFAVGSGGLVADYLFFEDFFNKARAIDPEAKLLIGGHIVRDVDSRVLFKHVPVDYAVRGEAETILPALLECMRNGGQGLDTVPGLIFREASGDPVTTPPAKRADLTKGGILPSFRFFDHGTWPVEVLPIPVLTGRGCFGVCTFCSPAHRTFIPRTFDDIFAELDVIINEYKVPQVYFQNDIFFRRLEMIQDFCSQYARRYATPFSCTLRVDMADVLPIVADAGCVAVHIGAESGSDKVLKRMRKNITTDQTRHFVAEAKRLGLQIMTGFLFGNEGETEEDQRLTLELHEELQVTSAFHYTTPYHGTQLFKNARKNNHITDDYEFFHHLPAIYASWYTKRILCLYALGANGQPVLPNITDIPDDQYPEVMRASLKRFYANYRIVHPRFFVEAGRFLAEGTCPLCGKTIKTPFPENRPVLWSLSCDKQCPSLLNLHLSLFDQEDFARHLENLRQRLRDKKRLMLAGRPDIIEFLLDHDVLGFPLERLVGLTTLTAANHGTYLYEDKYGHRVLSSLFTEPSAVADLHPDAVILADVSPLAARHAAMLVAAGVPAELLFHVAPRRAVEYPQNARFLIPSGPPGPDERFVLWPLGVYSRSLLASGAVPRERVAAFVDRGAVPGQEYQGVPVLPPERLSEAGATAVLVTSGTFGLEILETLRAIPGSRALKMFYHPKQGWWEQCLDAKGRP